MPDVEERKQHPCYEEPIMNPQWGTEIPPEYDLTEPDAIK